MVRRRCNWINGLPNTRRLAKRGVSLYAEEETRRPGRKQGRAAADGLVLAGL